MPAAVQPPVMEWFGSVRVFLGSSAPSQPEDGTFALGDLVINSSPGGGGPGVWAWVCVIAGPAGDQHFSSILLS